MRIPVCPHCKQQTDSLLLEGKNEKGETVYKKRQFIFPVKDSNGKILWKNVFHIDWFAVAIIITLLITTWGYKHDVAKCEEAIKNPCGFCSTHCNLPGNNYNITDNNNLFSNESNIQTFNINSARD